MHNNRISPARKILAWAVALLGLALLSGCDTVTLTNLTPASMPENPSQIYTFTLRVTPRTNTVVKTSVAPHIVIDGKNFEMNKSAIGEGLYEFDYQVAAGREDLAYYYLVNYSVEGNNQITAAEAYTEITRAKIVRRYVLSLEVTRGPVGSRISVLGRGFTQQDVVNFNGTPVRTAYESPTSLAFYVPAMDGGRNYQVSLSSASGNSPIGLFRIDASSLQVMPSVISVAAGTNTSVTFSIGNPAPAGGTLLDVTTDVPESVIMPEVIVPQGQNSVTVTIRGGKPGTGSLFLKGFGSGEVTVPVTVTGR